MPGEQSFSNKNSVHFKYFSVIDIFMHHKFFLQGCSVLLNVVSNSFTSDVSFFMRYMQLFSLLILEQKLTPTLY